MGLAAMALLMATLLLSCASIALRVASSGWAGFVGFGLVAYESPGPTPQLLSVLVDRSQAENSSTRAVSRQFAVVRSIPKDGQLW